MILSGFRSPTPVFPGDFCRESDSIIGRVYQNSIPGLSLSETVVRQSCERHALFGDLWVAHQIFLEVSQ